MNKDSALVALQAIDVIVYKSSHKVLSAEDLVDLRNACTNLIQSVESDNYIAKRAAQIISLVEAAFLGSAIKPGINQEEILERGISLSLFIQRQPDEGPKSEAMPSS